MVGTRINGVMRLVKRKKERKKNLPQGCERDEIWCTWREIWASTEKGKRKRKKGTIGRAHGGLGELTAVMATNWFSWRYRYVQHSSALDHTWCIPWHRWHGLAYWDRWSWRPNGWCTWSIERGNMERKMGNGWWRWRRAAFLYRVPRSVCACIKDLKCIPWDNWRGRGWLHGEMVFEMVMMTVLGCQIRCSQGTLAQFNGRYMGDSSDGGHLSHTILGV